MQSIIDQLLLLSVCDRFPRNIQLRSPFFQLSAPRRNVQHDTTLTILLHSPFFSLLFCDVPSSAPPLATSAGDLDLSLSLETGDCIGNLSASRSRSSRCSSTCLPCQSAGVTGVPSSCPSCFTLVPKRASQACMLHRCVLVCHTSSKTVEMLLLLHSQHEVFSLPCCTQPASLALRPSFGFFKTREVVLKIFSSSFSMSTTCCALPCTKSS